MSSYEKQVGELINEQYKIQRILGTGFTGTTYLCSDVRVNKVRIVKHIYKNLSVFDLKEMMILKNINYLSFPEIIDVFQDSTGIYVIQTYIEGETLESKLSKFTKLKSSMVIDIAKQICDSLIYLHNFKPNGLICNNLSIYNVIMTKDNKAILIDLCCVKKYYNNAKNDVVFLENRSYKAPEYIQGCVDKKSDIYSLGVVMYQLITGKIPYFEDTLLKEIKKDKNISKDLKKIILKCIEKDPNYRYQSVEELKNSINSIDYIKVAESKSKATRRTLVLILSILLMGLFGFSSYNVYNLYKQDEISKAQEHKKETKKAKNLKKELEDYKNKTNKLTKELDKTKKQSQNLTDELTKKEKEKQIYQSKLEKANATISSLGSKISDLNSKIAQNDSQVKEYKSQLSGLNDELKSAKDEQQKKEIEDRMQEAETKIQEFNKAKEELAKQKADVDKDKLQVKEMIEKYKNLNGDKKSNQ